MSPSCCAEDADTCSVVNSQITSDASTANPSGRASCFLTLNLHHSEYVCTPSGFRSTDTLWHGSGHTRSEQPRRHLTHSRNFSASGLTQAQVWPSSIFSPHGEKAVLGSGRTIG